MGLHESRASYLRPLGARVAQGVGDPRAIVSGVAFIILVEAEQPAARISIMALLAYGSANYLRWNPPAPNRPISPIKIK